MSLHQNKVTITAIDLSKVSENYCVVVNYEDEEPTASELSQIRTMLTKTTPDARDVPIICLKHGHTLTISSTKPTPTNV